MPAADGLTPATSERRRRHHQPLRAGRVLRLYTSGGPIEIQIADCDATAKVRLVIDSVEPTTLSHAAKPRIFPRRRPDTQEVI
jgi:hypothetical protein